MAYKEVLLSCPLPTEQKIPGRPEPLSMRYNRKENRLVFYCKNLTRYENCMLLKKGQKCTVVKAFRDNGSAKLYEAS